MNGAHAYRDLLPPGSEYIEPWDGWLLVEDCEPDRMTHGGLFLPETARQTSLPRGIVRAVSPGFLIENLEPGEQTVEPGDTIIYQPNNGWWVDLNGKRMVMLEGQGIAGVIRTKGGE